MRSSQLPSPPTRLLAVLAAALFLSACGPADVEVAGEWTSEFYPSLTITNEKWGENAIVSFDNAKRFAITQNPADAEWNAGKFNREVWVPATTGAFHWCTEAFAQDSAKAAEEATAKADAADLEAGCGGFSWTRLTRK